MGRGPQAVAQRRARHKQSARAAPSTCPCRLPAARAVCVSGLSAPGNPARGRDGVRRALSRTPASSAWDRTAP
jgi:hypothetical protein